MEIWKDIAGFEGLYQVSNLGNVKSLPRRTTKGVIMKQHVNKRNGYCYVGLSNRDQKVTRRVHCLVMNAFYPVNKKEGYDKEYTINHKDGDKTNNKLDNLEWCSQRDNQNHAYAIGLEGKTGIKTICLDTGVVYNTVTDAVIDCGGKCGEMVARVCRGERSHYRGRHFAYLDDYLSGNIPEYKGRVKRKVSDMLWQ